MSTYLCTSKVAGEMLLWQVWYIGLATISGKAEV